MLKLKRQTREMIVDALAMKKRLTRSDKQVENLFTNGELSLDYEYLVRLNI